MDDLNAAHRDCANNDPDVPSMTFTVIITEMLRLAVTVEAKDEQETEQIVSDGWHNSQYVLGSENFVGAEFEAAPVNDQLENG